MDETELRLHAIELLLIELMADLEPQRLAAASERIRAGLPTTDPDENDARLQALVLIQDAVERHDGVTGGVLIPRPKG